MFSNISKLYAGGICIGPVCNKDMQREKYKTNKTITALEDKPRSEFDQCNKYLNVCINLNYSQKYANHNMLML